MKKIICFFIILMQSSSFLFSVLAQEQNISNAVTTEQQTVSNESQPAEQAQKAEEVKAPVAKEEAKGQAVKNEPKQEVKEPAPCEAPQEAQATVILRERVSDQNPLRKVARGAVNTTLGWVEIPRQMIKENKSKGDIAGVFWGPLKGFAFFVGRTAVGLYEVTTFLIPPYKPVVNPEFILSEENDDE